MYDGNRSVLGVQAGVVQGSSLAGGVFSESASLILGRFEV